VDCGLILDKSRGLFTNWNGIIGFKFVDSVHGSWTMDIAGPRWTTDRASVAAHRSSA
jgi:hypothetical protein